MPITTGQPSWTGATGAGLTSSRDDGSEALPRAGDVHSVFNVEDGRAGPDFNRIQGEVAPPYQYKTAQDDLHDSIFAPSSKQVGLDLGLVNNPTDVRTNGINVQGVFTSGAACNPLGLEGNSMIPALTPTATDDWLSVMR